MMIDWQVFWSVLLAVLAARAISAVFAAWIDWPFIASGRRRASED